MNEYMTEPTRPVKQSDDPTMNIVAHLIGLVTGFLGPLVMLFVIDDKHTVAHCKAALNWQLSFLIYIVASVILVFVVVGILLLFVLPVVNIVFCVMGAVKAKEGILWEYPFTIRFLS
jgi:uncharacterized Tic20 family protein